MRKRKLVFFWIRLVILCCVLAVVVNAAGVLLSGGDDVVKNASALRSLPRNSVDVFWTGTSHMHYNVIPQKLYDDYGITSTMVSGNSLDLTQTYWQIRQALLTQSPEVIVLDVYPAAAPYCYFYVQNVLAMQSTERMTTGSNPYNTASGLARWLPVGSPFKPFAVKEAYEAFGLEGEAYFELTRFHSRYGELGRRQFEIASGNDRLAYNFGYLYGDYVLDQESVSVRPYTLEEAQQANEIGTFWTFTEEQLAQVQLMDKTVRELERIIAFVQKKGIDLVLCASPYQTNAAEEKLFAEVGMLAQKHGVPFVALDDTDANDPEYFRDLGHLNDDGARVYTDFWGGYLMENFGLSDRRESNDERYAPWREREGSHDRQREAMNLIRYEGGLTGYLEALSGLAKDHLMLFTIEGDVYEGFTEDDYWLLVDELGIPEEALEEWYYTGCGTLDLLLMDGQLLFSRYDPEGREEEIVRSINGFDIVFGTNRWRVNGESAGDIEEGFNVSVYAMTDRKLMDYRTFDMTEIYFEEW